MKCNPIVKGLHLVIFSLFKIPSANIYGNVLSPCVHYKPLRREKDSSCLCHVSFSSLNRWAVFWEKLARDVLEMYMACYCLVITFFKRYRSILVPISKSFGFMTTFWALKKSTMAFSLNGVFLGKWFVRYKFT